MKIVVLCPGSFTNGLNSPERGEGRWSQNFARMLARAGHEVYAASMGNPEPRRHYDVNLIHETNVNDYGPFDIYIDSAWWDDKPVKAIASKYISLKWSVESYMRDKDLPDNFYYAYPYPSHHWEFANFRNTNKSFALPTMFGEKFEEPKWNNDAIFLPGKIDLNRDYKKYIPAIGEFLNKYRINGGSRQFFEQEFGNRIDFGRPGSNWYNNIPYDQVLDYMRQSKLSLPILNPGCMIEATFIGLPSIFWEHGGFFNPLGDSLGITIGSYAEPERFTEVANMLMTDRKKYMEVVRTMQHYFSYHTYEGSLGYFNLMVASIF